MQYNAATPSEYMQMIPDDRKEAMEKLRSTIADNIPPGFEENVGYGMLGWAVPHTLYPDGYHCEPKQPLPFLSIASQKNSISFYHMGIYADKELYDWFVAEYPKHSTTKLDMGKSCIRFKNPKNIPYNLIGELVSKITPQQWIVMYEANLKR